jgi:hypothetical protein
MSKSIHRVWTFASGSNPNVEYQTLQYADGSTSCNCPGWTRRVAADGSRSCKHTRSVDMGTADRNCTATHEYGTAQSQQPHQPTHQHAQRKIKTAPKLGQRKFAV